MLDHTRRVFPNTGAALTEGMAMIVIEGSEPDRNKPAAPAVVPPVMRREERLEPDGRRLLLYHFDRPIPPEPAAKKEPTDG